MNVAIKRIDIYLRPSGPDQIELKTDLPSALPNDTADSPSLTVWAARGYGVKWVLSNFEKTSVNVYHTQRGDAAFYTLGTKSENEALLNDWNNKLWRFV